jgi:micrococcal nuclease
MGSKPTIVYDDTIPFVPDVKEALVIKVYDGDTFTIGFRQPYSDKPFRIPVRLLGIDTPEMKTKNTSMKAKAKASKDFLSSLIMNKTVSLNDTSMDKYGRLLANVYCEGVFVNQAMLDKDFAVVYS